MTNAPSRTAKVIAGLENWFQFRASDSDRQMLSRRPHDTLRRLRANNGRAGNQHL